MASPSYNKQFTATKNLRRLLTALSVPNIAGTAENLIAQALNYFVTVGLALEGTLSVAGRLTLAGIIVGSVDTRTGAGAVGVTTLTTKVVTTGANALTLADGAAGQLKVVTMITDGGDAVLTPATKTGFTTITFDAVGDSVTLQFHTTVGWMLVSNVGAAVA